MVGIDHSKANIAEREQFAFTKNNAVIAMVNLKQKYHLSGCVIVSTCNRTELWLSGCGVCSPWQILCELKQLDPAQFGEIYVERQGKAAVNHLLELACGLKSKVFGEDQIISQLKDALSLARECNCAGPVLEACFRTAITGAKKVKTYVRLTPYDSSVATSMLNQLKQLFDSLVDRAVLVVGNGEMGRLVAKTLLAEGCRVTMTLRQYKRGNAVIPEGCQVLPYEDRMAHINGFQIIVSVTASPHYTFHGEDVFQVLDEKQRVWMDLAVPRDIDPVIGTDSRNLLFDIDKIGGITFADEDNPGVAQAREILAEYQKEFEDWYYFRNLAPMVDAVGQRLAAEMAKRNKSILNELALPPETQQKLQQELEQTAEKVVCNLLYGVKEQLPRESWQECLAALERSAYRS